MKKLSKRNNLQTLFGVPSVQYLFVARNAPNRAIVVSNRSGDYQLHAVDFDTGFHRQITKTKGGSLFGSISSNGKYIYILSDASGAEHGHFIRVPFEGGRGVDITPELKKYFSYSVSTSDDSKVMCFTAALNNKNNIFLVKEDKRGKFKTQKFYSTQNALSETICDSDGKIVCVAETVFKTGKSHLVFLPTDRGGKITRSAGFNGSMPLVFSNTKKNKKVLALVRQSEWYRPVLYSTDDNHVTKIEHPSFKGDVWALFWNEELGQIVLCDVHNALQKLYIYNIETGSLKPIGPKTGSFNYHFGSVALNNKKSFIIRWSDFNTSPSLVKIFSSQNKKWNKVKEWSGNISSNYLVESKWVKSSDGERVHIWIVRRKGLKKAIPFVIDIHGGPHGVVLNEFSPKVQAWINKGFGYCAVNYRGSTGFNKKFEQKIYGNPGHWEVEDIVAARNWLVKNKYANSKNITLYGWSWGGYVVMLAVGKYPNLWNSAIAGAGIADCVMQYEDEPSYFKAQDQKRFKGTPETVLNRYIKSSPTTYVSDIETPLLIIHGENDVRCPPRQIKHFSSLLKKNNKKFEIKWFKSGHMGGFTDTKLRVKLIKRLIEFAKKF